MFLKKIDRNASREEILDILVKQLIKQGFTLVNKKGTKMNTFKCPECGLAEVASNLCVSTDWSVTGQASSAWSYVLQQIHCANCDEYIPSHLEKDGIIFHTSKQKKNGLQNTNMQNNF